MLFMGIAPLLKWNRTKADTLSKQLIFPALISLVLSSSICLWKDYEWIVFISLFVAFWVLTLILIDLLSKLVVSGQNSLQRIIKLPRNYYGMLIAHLGMAISLIGIVFVSVHSDEEMVKMELNDRLSLSGYEFVFNGVSKIQGPNYSADRGELFAFQNGKQVAVLYPEKRFYNVRGQVMTEAAIDGGLFRDLYVSLGEQLEDGSWSIRVHIKPFVRWIWLGGLFMTLGGIFIRFR